MAPSSSDGSLENPPLELSTRHTRSPTPAEVEFLKIYTGDNRIIEYKKDEGLECLQHMYTLIGLDAINLFRTMLDEAYHRPCRDLDRILWALCATITVFRAEPTISISRLAARLVRDSVFRLTAEGSDLPIRQCLISLIGWCSLLFIPSRIISDGAFNLDTQGAKCFSRTSISLESAQRPIDELLRSFGELLPKKRTYTSHATETHGSLKFQVSNLNIATLKKLANVEVIWVDAVSAHLNFDPTTATLCIFRAPSYCKLNPSDNTFLSMSVSSPRPVTLLLTFTRITKDFYTEHECPTEEFSPQNLMKEIILSYGLLFHDWRLARKIYRKEERNRTSTMILYGRANVDLWLDKLCGMDLPTSIFSSMWSKYSIRETYDANSQFPILSGRLKIIQDYIEGIQPSRFASLWNDRRDLRLWYTVWAVLIIGGISILQASFSLILSAAQVAIAAKAYDLQIQQLQSTATVTAT